MPKYRSLSPKQEKFIEEYIKTGNGKEAALRVYNTTDGKTAKSIAVENLSKPAIQAEIQRKKADLAKEFKIEAINAFNKLKEYIEQDKINGMALTPRTRLEALKLLLDYAGYAPSQKVESINLNISAQEETRRRAAELIKKKQEECIDINTE